MSEIKYIKIRTVRAYSNLWIDVQLSKIIVTVLKDPSSDPLIMKVYKRVVQVEENVSSQ